jgi:hypothetical protein
MKKAREFMLNDVILNHIILYFVFSLVMHENVSLYKSDTEDPYHGGPGLCYLEEPDQPAFEPLPPSNIGKINSGFPPSFTEMLANLSTENEKGK